MCTLWPSDEYDFLQIPAAKALSNAADGRSLPRVFYADALAIQQTFRADWRMAAWTNYWSSSAAAAQALRYAFSIGQSHFPICLYMRLCPYNNYRTKAIVY